MRPALPTLLLVAVLAGGCGNPVDAITGGDPTKDYCSALGADRREFAAMIGDGSPTALVVELPMLRALAAKAPDDLADEWQAFLSAITGLRDALAAAHVSPSAYRDGKAPKGLTVAQHRAISDAADRLSSDATVQAAAGIEQEARDVCKINLGM